MNEERKLLVIFLVLLASIWPAILFTISLSDKVTFTLRGSPELQDFAMILFVFVLLASLGAWLLLLRWFIIPRGQEMLFVMKEKGLTLFFLKESHASQTLSDAVPEPLNEEQKSLPVFWILLLSIGPLIFLKTLFFDSYGISIKKWGELPDFVFFLFAFVLLASLFSWSILLASYIATKAQQASFNSISWVKELESQEMLSSEENEEPQSDYLEKNAGK